MTHPNGHNGNDRRPNGNGDGNGMSPFSIPILAAANTDVGVKTLRTAPSKTDPRLAAYDCVDLTMVTAQEPAINAHCLFTSPQEALQLLAGFIKAGQSVWPGFDDPRIAHLTQQIVLRGQSVIMLDMKVKALLNQLEKHNIDPVLPTDEEIGAEIQKRQSREPQ